MSIRARTVIVCAAIAAIMPSLPAAGAAGPPLPARRPPATAPRALSALAQAPLFFTENKGQLDGRVAYYVQGQETSFYFTARDVTFTLAGDRGHERWNMKLEFVGANPAARPLAHDPTQTSVSYFKGPRSAWKSGLGTYSTVTYAGLWPGIDLSYTGTFDRLKYTFVVHPGADPRQIRLAYRGPRSVKVDAAGRLEVETPLRTLSDDTPYAYQGQAEREVAVTASYDVQRANDGSWTYGFQVGEYDRTRPLVIDPSLLVYSGFVGGLGQFLDAEFVNAIAVDADGHAYITGRTESSSASFPEVTGPDLTYNDNGDVFVAKVKSDGSGFEYAGYLGGSDSEEGLGIAVDAAGNAYVTGYTFSNDTSEQFPVMVGPDLTFNGSWSGNNDAFVAKVNATGTGLVYCGYIGGNTDDRGLAIAVDALGRAYVTGYTNSNEDQSNSPTAGKFTVSVGPDLTFNGAVADEDAFVARIKDDGSAFEYVGYLGGSGKDRGQGIAVDSTGHAYVTGITLSSDSTFPVQTGPQLVHAGGNGLGFVVKVKSDGTGLDYAGFVGPGTSQMNGIAVDAAGSAYVAGGADAGFTVISGPGPYQGDGFHSNAFVAKVLPDGSGYHYAGYVGGVGQDTLTGIAIDAAGHAYVVGYSTAAAPNFPPLAGPGGGQWDLILARVAADGTALDYAGSLGGSSFDVSSGIAVDGAGAVYVTGWTQSSDFPKKVGPVLTKKGQQDGFITKLGDPPPASEWANLSIIKTAGPDPLAAGQPLVYNFIVTNNGPADATQVQVTDALPAPLKSAPAYCSGNPLVCTINSLPAGQTALVTVTVQPAAAGPLSNTATVSGAQFDGDTSNNTSTVITTVNPASADVQVVGIVAVIGNPAVPTVVYQIAITNNGPSPATNVMVTDTLPPSLTLLFSPDPQCMPAGNGVSCLIPTLDGGDIATITVVAKANSGGLILNQACASGAEPDPNPANNCANASIFVVIPLPLKIGKLIGNVQRLVDAEQIGPGEGRALLVILSAALREAERGHTEAAVSQLRAFILEVQALQRTRRLSPELAGSLVAQAEAIIQGALPR